MDERQLQLLKDSGINVDAVIGRFGGRADLLKKFILKFLDDKCYDNLIAALESGDVESAFMAAHTMKGVASNLGLDPLHDVADEVTEILRPKEAGCIDEAKGHIDRLSAAYNQMIEVIGKIAQ